MAVPAHFSNFAENDTKMMRELTAVSLFCGAGGLDMGFDRAGFKTVWANDWDKDACKTHQNWSNAEVVCGDISRIDMSTIPVSDVILGGFPCQGFSLSGPRKIDDSRNVLYKHYVKLVRRNQPKVFVGENVKGLLTMGSGSIFDAIKVDFAECGYDVYAKLVNARNFGVPQDRERVIIVGFRKDLGVTEFELPEGNGGRMNLREALEGMAAPGWDEVCRAPYSSRYMSRNRRRDWDEVSFTIPAMAKQVALYPGSPRMLRLGKDKWAFGEGETRRLSWREAAAIQTFPGDMAFFGDQTSIYKQIGNAVPVKLAEFVARYIRPYVE